MHLKMTYPYGLWPSILNSSASHFLQESGFEHEAAGVHLAIHLVVTADETDAFDLGAHLEGDRRAFYFQILDQHHCVAVVQYRAIGVLDRRVAAVIKRGIFYHRPLVATVGADVVAAVRVGIFEGALRTSRQCGHRVFNLESEKRARVTIRTR